MIIFDMDQTLVDTSSVEALRSARKWPAVMTALPKLPVYPGISKLFADLRAAGQPVAIVTKSPDMIARKLAELQGWEIDSVVGYHQVSRRKPDPEGLQVALRKAGAKAEQSYHVGDQPEDTQASRAAGVVAIGAAWGITDTRALAESCPDHLFTSVAELDAFFRETLGL